MKLTKKKIIIISVILILITSWYFYNKQEKAKLVLEEKAKLLYTVKKGDIKTEVKVTASAKLADEQNLSFGREGKITNVYVKVGDEVKAGDVLAELSMDEYNNSIDSAILDLESANLGLNKLLNNDTSVLEAQLQSQINEAESSYKLEQEQFFLLEKQLETSLKSEKDSLEQMARDYSFAEQNLEIAKAGLEVNSKIETEKTENALSTRNQTITGIISSVNSSLGDLKSQIEKVDKVFGVSESFEDDNDEYEDLLSAKSSNLKNKTEALIQESYSIIKKYEDKSEDINSELSDKEINSIIQSFYEDSEMLVELFDTAIDATDNSIESINSLSSTKIDGFISTFELARSTTIATRNQLQSLSNSINSLLSGENQTDQLELSLEQKELNYNMLVSSLEKQKEDLLTAATNYENLKKDNKNSISRKQTQINNLSEKISVLKKELENIIDGPDKYDLKQQRNQIKQASLRIERVRDSKDNYQIIADFDGRVRTVGIVEGEQYELENREFIVIENPELIELELQVNQIDIVKIHKGDPVIVTFDSYPNNPIESTVSDREVNPESNGRGGIYYKAKILLEKQDLEILAGMSAIVKILTSKADDVILIPTLGLVQEGDKQFVYKKNGESFKKHEIKTGIVNNFQAEIIEGLNPGDVIRASVLDDEALKEMGIDDGSDSPFGK